MSHSPVCDSLTPADDTGTSMCLKLEGIRMPTTISPLSQVHPAAQIGADVEIGPFCLIGPDVKIGEGCVLESHAVLTGRVTLGARSRVGPHCYLGAETRGPITSQIDVLTEVGEQNVLFPRASIVGNVRIGDRNQFFDNVVIGRAPQDAGYKGAPTGVIVGNDNVFRENVTIHRGAEKEDGWTRVGHGNVMMENSHVGHNCHVHDHITMANNVALAGHVHVFDRAIIGGNTGVHQFATVGTLAFIGGVSRVTTDAPPYMMYSGNDEPRPLMLNLVGVRRNGISEDVIRLLKDAFKLSFRHHKSLAEIREHFATQIGDVMPIELGTLLNFLDAQAKGISGRAREAIRSTPAFAYQPQHIESQRKAA